MHQAPISTTGPWATTARADLDLLLSAARAEALLPFLVADEQDPELAIIDRAILAGHVEPRRGLRLSTSTANRARPDRIRRLPADRPAPPAPAGRAIRRLVVFVPCAQKAG